MQTQFFHLYNFGDMVYLKTDIEQKPRMVVGFILSGKDDLIYKLACAEEVSEHYEIEIVKNKIVF